MLIHMVPAAVMIIMMAIKTKLCIFKVSVKSFWILMIILKLVAKLIYIQMLAVTCTSISIK